MQYKNNENRFCYPRHFPIGGSLFFPTLENKLEESSTDSNYEILCEYENRTEITDKAYE
ncbi:Uncharacterised protein [uncultured archaeon]|nr:Uncharacterised protein [uncultured archaeon]